MVESKGKIAEVTKRNHQAGDCVHRSLLLGYRKKPRKSNQ